MSIAQSKLTAQGQISVPAEVRRRLGIGPGAIIDWQDRDGSIVVSKAGTFSFDDMREALFDQKPARAKPLRELKDGIRRRMRDHAGD